MYTGDRICAGLSGPKGGEERREVSGAVGTVMEPSVEGIRVRGRPKKKWLNGIERDTRVCG